MLNSLAYDLEHGLRALLRDRAFTVVALLSLALGVGANAAVFSLVDQVLVQRLPARAPEQLVLLSWNGTFVGKWWGRTTDRDLVSHALYRDLEAENQSRLHVFSGLFARKPTSVTLAAAGEPEMAPAELVSGSYFRVLGVGAALGRVLDDSDDRRPGEHPVVVLSFDYWKNRLGAPRDIVGRALRVNGGTMTVVGVAAAGFRGTDPLEVPVVWIPTMMQRQASPEYAGWLEDHRAKWLHVFGRLAPEVSIAQARASLQPWFKATLEADTRRADWPVGLPAQQRASFVASTLEVSPASQGRSEQRGILQRPLLILLGATGLVLLLACLNVANLFLARAFARRGELALRVALGASGRRVARALAVETALLALGGAGAGVLLAPFVSRALIAFLPDTVTLSADVDARVFLFALAAALVTGVLFGVAPALQAGRTQPALALKAQSATLAGGMRLRRALVVGQMALALVLLVGAGLFVRTLAGLRGQAEYATPNLLTFRVDLSKAGYAPPAAKQRIVDLLAAVRALPEVETAALSRLQLMSGGGWDMPFTVGPGDPIRTAAVSCYAVSSGLFSALGVPMLEGHDFPEQDSEVPAGQEYRAAIVSESFVRRYLPGRRPIGARLGFGGSLPEIEIVGVTRDFHYRGLRRGEVQAFFPAFEKSLQSGTFFARTRGPAPAAFASIQAAVRGIDPTVPVLGLRTVDQQLDSALVTERLLAALAVAFAALATALACIGLYGVMAFVVLRRRRELGIRMALGASPGGAVALVVREAVALVAVGLALGLPLTWALGRLVQSQLFGVSAMQASIVGGATVLLALVAVAATAVPARRASAVDAMEALRAE